MSIIRAPRPDSKFYTLDKSISEDERLSWAARGLLIFLLGKPDHWEVSVRHLIGQTKDAIGKSSGRDAVRVILKELEQAGYLRKGLARAEGGAFAGMDYIVCEKWEAPETGNPGSTPPETDNPAPADPAPAKPAPENPPLIKNKDKQLIERAAKTDSKFPEQPADADSPAAEGELIEADKQEGEGGLIPTPKPKPRVEIPHDMPGPKDPNCKTFKAWANYATAYRKRYSAWPVWNAKVGSQISQLVSRLGADVAHSVAAYYVTINDARLINDCHSLNNLLAKCEAYHTQWQTGRQMNSATARQLEQTQANVNAAQEAAQRIREKGGKRNAFL